MKKQNTKTDRGECRRAIFCDGRRTKQKQESEEEE